MDDNKDTSFVRQFDPLVFELLHPIGSLSTANRGKLLEKARHIRLAPGRGVSAKDWSWSLLYLLDGSLEREVAGTYLHLPLLLKLSTNRLNNIRPYIIGGVSYDYNFSSNENNGKDKQHQP